MLVSTIYRLIYTQIDIYLSGLARCRLMGLIPCFAVLFYGYFRKPANINPVDGISLLAMMSSTRKLALLGKNDFEPFSFPINFLSVCESRNR